MNDVDLPTLLAAANGAVAERRPWHFHSLANGCSFNPRNDCRAILLEQPGHAAACVAYGDDQVLAPVVKRLATMLHGEAMLNAPPAEESGFDQATRRMLACADELAGAGVHWHHHMFGHDCLLNPHAPRHCLMLEDPRNGARLEAVFDHLPESELAAIEQRFFAQP